jgi:hypothetical protein
MSQYKKGVMNNRTNDLDNLKSLANGLVDSIWNNKGLHEYNKVIELINC